MDERIINQVNKYYTEKVLEFGATPKGVDWNGVESQELRFAQLLKVADREINDDFTACSPAQESSSLRVLLPIFKTAFFIICATPKCGAK